MAAAGTLQSSLEWIALRNEIGSSGFYGVDPRIVVSPFHRYWSSRLGFVLLNALRASLSALLLAGSLVGPTGALAWAVLFATSKLLSLRVRFGLEAADQMHSLSAAALAVAAVAPGDPLMEEAALWFLAGQSALAYATSGFTKAGLDVWRDGSLLAGLVRTKVFGHPLLVGWIRPGGSARGIAWAIMVFESAFPLALVGGRSGALFFCACGLIFHLLNAWFLGLNLFVLAFLATYPAIIHCAVLVQKWAT